MKRASLFLSLLTLFCFPIVGSAQDGDAPRNVVEGSEEELRQMLEEELQKMVEAQPDTLSENWKELTDDLGLMVFRDRNGVTRGTLYVLQDEKWHPIAVEGVSELGPRVVPAGR